MDLLREREELKRLVGHVPRSKRQTNHPFESDTEILRLDGRYLVSSTDTIAEEISMGLYESPYSWGWLAVMSSVSDLAASGAEALGLLLSTQWAFSSPARVHREVYRGVRDALAAAAVPLLGGDSGKATDHVLTSTILGVSTRPPLTRIGTRVGDRVFLMTPGALGAGPALALRYLAKAPARVFSEKHFRPRPDWRAMKRLRPALSAAIDTSDGLAVSLAILGNLNDVGFRLKWEPSTLLPAARRAMKSLDLPEPLLWMSDLGDLQILMTARPAAAARLRRHPSLVEIGEAVPAREGFTLDIGGGTREFPVSWVTRCPRDLDSIARLSRRLHHHFR